MATLEELEVEVGKLRRKVRQLEGPSAAAADRKAVSELVNEGNGDERLVSVGGSQTGFARACRESNTTRWAKLDRQAVREGGSGAG